MNNRKYIEYLNSLHNYNAQNENAYGEKNVENPYFKEIMVRVGLCDYIKDSLTLKKPHILILTGHAGDGKTSIMYQVLTDLGVQFDSKEKVTEICFEENKKCLCVKDFSELPEEDKENQISRISIMRKSVDMVKNGNYVFMVANTGPIINTFGELFDKKEEEEEAKIKLINMMDSNAGEIDCINDIPMSVINVANVDNVYFATEFLDKIIQEKLWTECKNCNKQGYCHIYRNRNLISENKSRVFEFVKSHFVWLLEYGTRLTIRSMTEQLAYMITGGVYCEEIDQNEPYKYLFSNLFFGYIGTKLNERALGIMAIEAANRCLYDHKRLRSDEKLLIRKDYKKLFGEYVEEIIKDAEKNNAFIKGWTEFLRRTYFFMNIVTDNEIVEQDYEDIFSKQFRRYIQLRDGIDTPSIIDANLIADALSMIYVGTPSDGKEIPLTLSRESGISQNVQLVTGTIPARKLRLEAKETADSTFMKGKKRYELKLKIGKEVLDTVLNLPILDYFEELKNGVIATNIDPQLSHGVESLKNQIAEKIEEDDDENIIEIIVLKNSGNSNICLGLTDYGKIREI